MSQLSEHVETLRLVDHHVHGAFAADGGEARLQNALNEASLALLEDPQTAWDSQVGFAVRRWCSELLDLPRHAPVDAYWNRRAELGEAEVTCRFLRASGVDTWLVDTGLPGDSLLDPSAMAESSGGDAYEVLRLETLAEELIAEPAGAEDFVSRFGQRLATPGAGVIAAKSVLAYRGGFDHDLSRPEDAEVGEAAGRWRDRSGESGLLTDVIIMRFAIHAALDAGLPLQLHTGFGDSDLRLDRANPVLLTELLRSTASRGTPIVLLHCYPYEREAGYLAQAFEHVHLDVGLAVNFTGAASGQPVARSLELAPFHKLLYSSDAAGPAELHHLGARLWRNAVSSLLDGWVERDEWSAADACRVTSMIGRDNARRVYGLP